MRNTKNLLIAVIAFLAAVLTMITARPNTPFRKHGLKYTMGSFEVYMHGLPMVAGAAGSRFSENNHVISCHESKDWGGAVATGESINSGKFERLTYIFHFGAITGNPVLTLKSGATDGTQTTSETFRYRIASADTLVTDADQYGAWATSSSLTLTGTTTDHKVLVMEIDCRAITDGQPFLTPEFSNVTALNMASVAIGQPRYKGNNMPTAVA